MNTFKRKSLFAALGGLAAAGAVGTAHAVYVNNDGLGQALIYPYYTVRAGNDTLMSVVNSTSSSKLVKVRYLESQNSKEVLDFNLWLSPFDVWTGSITATAAGAKLTTVDKSCTTPAIPAGGVDFRNILFGDPLVGGEPANADKSLDRTREGYVEVLEMATLLPGGTLETAIKHVNGVPPCTGLPGTTITAAQSAQLLSPTGGLFGAGSIINVAGGTDQSYDAVAFDQWRSLPIYTGPSIVTPTLANALPTISTVLSGTVGVTSSWLTGADAVSATIMHNNLYNEYVIDTTIKAATDWVITFPTKRFYVGAGVGPAIPPFTRNFDGVNGSCDDISLAYYDREERQPGQTIDFSPSLAPTGPQLCWEANVVTFNNTNVVASPKSRNISPTDPVTGALYPSGWAQIGFPSDGIAGASGVHKIANIGAGFNVRVDLANGAVSSPVTVTYFGLPSLGFAMQQYTNTVNAGCNASIGACNYGGTFVHKQSRDIR